MTWAAQRRLIIGLLLGAVISAVVTVLGFLVFYQGPTCSDGEQNQDESGVDCGGSCTRVCVDDAIAPVTLYTTLLQKRDGRTDLVTAIENRNGDLAAKDVAFTATLYNENGTIVEEVRGSVDLPPRTVMPVFLPGVLSGGETARRAFVAIDRATPVWFSLNEDPRIDPIVEVQPLTTSPDGTPRVQAVLTNASLTPLERIPVIAIVRDTSSGNIIAASQTLVLSLPPQQSSTATFTWTEVFTSESVRIEVLPVVPLP